MMTIDDFLATRYVEHGRVAPDLDCWGLVRLARAELFGKTMLPSFAGIDPQDKLGLTRAAIVVRGAGGFAPCPMRPGAIATGWQADICMHVGIVVSADSMSWVLETGHKTGPGLCAPWRFVRRYAKVVCYDD